MEQLLFIIDGKAKSYITLPDERKLLVGFYVKRGILGDVELLTDGICKQTVEALTEVTCIAISLEHSEERLRTNMDFMNFLGGQLAQKYTKTARGGAVNLMTNLETRLCSYILMTNEEGIFCENLTDVSEMLGTSYRHLLRTIDALRRDGVVEKAVKGYEVKDGMELQQRAQNFYTVL